MRGYPDGSGQKPTFTPHIHDPDILILLLVIMEDKRYTNLITYWCYAREPGKELTAIAPVSCKKEACERYRAEYPYCIKMERRDRRGFVIPV